MVPMSMTGCLDRAAALRVLASVVVAVLALSGPLVAAPASQVLSPEVIWIPEEYHTGGAYTAIQAGPDGRVYLGTTFYEGFARFLVLQPGERAFGVAADTAAATGESRPGPYAQAKIHTKPAVAPDGRVYFGTKSGKPARDERWQAGYPGGHLLVYDPQSRRVTDLGIVRPRQSIIAVGVDPRRGAVYALTDPDAHLFVYDPRARTFADKGALAPGLPQPTRYLIALASGDVFHAAGADAFMWYRAAAGVIERTALRFSGRGTYESPYALAPNVDGQRFHGVGERSGQVYTFVPQDGALSVQLHGSASEALGAGATHYTMTGAPDGNVYYTATVGGGAPEGTLFILRLVTRTGQPEVVGQVGPLAPPPFPLTRRPARRLMVQGSTTGPDGTLYVMLAYPLRVLVFPRLARP
jgi:hypothetical protein